MLIHGEPAILRPCNGPMGLNGTVFEDDPNAIATPSQVTQLYEELLGRDPDKGGLEFYSSGFPLYMVIADIKASEEYKAKQGILPTRDRPIDPTFSSPMPDLFREIDPIYPDLPITTKPEPEPLEPLPPYFTAPVLPEPVPEEYTFRAPGLPTLDQINAIYVNELGRNADPGGLAFYFEGQFPVDVIVNDIRQSAEWKALNRENRIRAARPALDDLYRAEVGRNATNAEVSAFVDVGRTLEAERDMIRKSAEYVGLVKARDRKTTQVPAAELPGPEASFTPAPAPAPANIAPLVLAVAAAYLIGA